MQTNKSDKRRCTSTRALKKYHPPKVVVHGDVKEITLNIGTVGAGDSAYEGKDCQSPGNCG